jgi:GcrA cell cycle regulator
MSKGWDSNMLKKLKALVGKGLSTSEMGRKLGMSKNAVVGKLNRLGWNAKATEPAEKKTAKSAKKETKTAKKPVAKKTPVKVTVKKEVKETTKKVAKKPVATKKETKPVVKESVSVEKEKAVVKTASKKTKKDLALHELLIQHALQMANLKPNQCRWPIGDPDSDNFHFCGETVFTGKPYCYEHCRQAYQFTPPKKK